jgi:hypothetical protein
MFRIAVKTKGFVNSDDATETTDANVQRARDGTDRQRWLGESQLNDLVEMIKRYDRLHSVAAKPC